MATTKKVNAFSAKVKANGIPPKNSVFVYQIRERLRMGNANLAPHTPDSTQYKMPANATLALKVTETFVFDLCFYDY